VRFVPVGEFQTSPGKSQDNIVMPDLAVEIVQKRSSWIRNDCAMDLVACELADGFKRLPEGNHYHFDAVANVTLKEHGILEAIELFQFRENSSLKVPCVMRSLLAAGTRRPVSCDH
jgi:hypothetical protein